MKPLTIEEKQTLNRIADEPRYWIQRHFKDLHVDRADEFFDLVDRLKAVWAAARNNRIDLCFALTIQPEKAASGLSIASHPELQRQQLDSGNQLIYEIDLKGNILDSLNLGSEIETTAVQQFSQIREIALFYLGADFHIFCKGHPWNPKHKDQVLREIKSRKRKALLSMSNFRQVLSTHFDQYVRDEARVKYWFKRNSLLHPAPESIFQQSLWSFIDLEVECIEAIREPMFKDNNRCDIKVIAENFDLYFIEIKWIGKSAVKKRKKDIIDGTNPHEFKVERAIEGAYQTKTYIDKHNSVEYDNRVRLGIYVVYDAYSPPRTPIDYGPEIRDYVLLRPIEFQLSSATASAATKGIAAAKGLVAKRKRSAPKK
jgi:hypothetical protein